MKPIYLLTLFVALALLAIPVSATIPITVPDSSQSYITWSWPAGMGITNESIDGVTVCGFDPYATSFTLSGLNPNEQHTIVLYNATDSGTNTTSTNADTTSGAQLTGTLNTWVYPIIIIVLLLCGMIRKLGILLPIASFVSIYALALYIEAHPVLNSNQITIELPFLIYVFFALFPYVLVYLKGGFLK